MSTSQEMATFPPHGDLFIDQGGFLCQTLPPPTSNLHRNNVRLEKWQDMLTRWDFELRSRRRRVLLRIRKGIPACLRGKVWYDIAEVQTVQECYPTELYSSFNQKETPAIREEEIMRDIHRTFPNHILFRDESGRNTLFRVLRAYSLFDPETGYCQGMGCLVGTLLMYYKEEKSFWVLVTMMRKYELKELYISGLPRAYRTIYIASHLIKHFYPNVYDHFTKLQLTPTMILTPWIMSHFTSGFHAETAVRIWDCFLAEGEKIWFRMILAVIEKASQHVLACEILEEALERISAVTKSGEADELLKCAFGVRLTRKRIARLDRKYAESVSVQNSFLA